MEQGPTLALCFTKTAEADYARHFEWPGKGPFCPPGERSDAGA
jgi:hypothetical protein